MKQKMQVSSSFMQRAKFDFCLSKIAIGTLFDRAAFVARLTASRYFPTVLRLAFVDPVHSRWLSRPGKFRATWSSRARELSPSSTRSTPWTRVKSSSKIPSSKRNNFLL
ncbi:hypothetical protein CAJAP_04605 [Camponotus japonicus]